MYHLFKNPIHNSSLRSTYHIVYTFGKNAGSVQPVWYVHYTFMHCDFLSFKITSPEDFSHTRLKETGSDN